MGQHRFHVASWCTHHMTGSAVHNVTVYLGLIRPGFALASCLATGEVADDIDAEIRVALADELEVLDPAELEVDAPDSDNMMEFLSELFEQCYVQASGHSAISLDVEEQEQKNAKRRKTYYVSSRRRGVVASGMHALRVVAWQARHCQLQIGTRR